MVLKLIIMTIMMMIMIIKSTSIFYPRTLATLLTLQTTSFKFWNRYWPFYLSPPWNLSPIGSASRFLDNNAPQHPYLSHEHCIAVWHPWVFYFHKQWDDSFGPKPHQVLYLICLCKLRMVIEKPGNHNIGYVMVTSFTLLKACWQQSIHFHFLFFFSKFVSDVTFMKYPSRNCL